MRKWSHCSTCGLWRGRIYADDELRLVVDATASCRMRDACEYLDRIEFECDETRILPKLVPAGPTKVYV